MLPCLSLLDAHLQLYLTSKKISKNSVCQVHFSVLVMRPPALASLDIEFLDDVDDNDVNVTASLCPGCAQQAVLITRATKNRERIWVESKHVSSFSAISCFVQSLKIRGVSQLKISLADLFWVLLDFTSFLFGQFLLVLCVLCKISSKEIFLLLRLRNFRSDSWVLLGVVNLIFATKISLQLNELPSSLG